MKEQERSHPPCGRTVTMTILPFAPQPLRRLALLLLPCLLAARPAQAVPPLAVGCDWHAAPLSVQTHNVGYLDRSARYHVAELPDADAGDGVRLLIHGRYPRAAYFAFQVLGVKRLGAVYDQLADFQLRSDLGIVAEPNVAALSTLQRDDNGDAYTLTVRYEDLPVPPASRAPNTLYAGARRGDWHARRLVLRVYGAAADALAGPDALPTLQYSAPNGSIELRDTPDREACAVLDAQHDSHAPMFVPALASSLLRFTPVVAAGDIPGLYGDGDARYLRVQPSLNYGQMVVIRARAPVAARQSGVAQEPDVRYWSLCQNELLTTRSVACIADRDMLVQRDGSFIAVLSPPVDRPATADAVHGYNWLDWGPSRGALIVLRQVLARPDFAGDYARAAQATNRSAEDVLGSWAPDATYCDKATFDANASAGGAAVMAACKAAAGRGRKDVSDMH